MKFFSFCSFAAEQPKSSWSQHLGCFIFQAALVLGLVAVLPSAAEKTVGHTQTRGTPASAPLPPPPPSAEQEQPGFFLRQLELLDNLRVGTDLKEAIRHQRQIKFKSSYGALPVALRLAAEQRNSNGLGRSLDSDDEVQVIFDDSSSSSRESSALKDLPPSSEVYFSPEVKPRKESQRKNLDTGNQTTHSLSQNNPFRFRTRLPPSKPSTFTFKKQGRLVMKKMVGKKLLRSGPPKPQKIEQFPIKLQVSSTENIENKVKKQHQSSRRDPFKPSGTRPNGGPNHEEDFKNPFYVETPPNAVSSYSVVPENSIIKKNKRGKSLDQGHHHQSATPKPSRLQHTKQANISTPQHKPGHQLTKPQSSVKTIHPTTRTPKRLRPSIAPGEPPISRRITKKKVAQNRKHSREGVQSWDHFLGAPHGQKQQRTPILKQGSSDESKKLKNRPQISSAISLGGNQKGLSSFRRGKSLSDNLLPMLQKMSPTKSGYPNLVRVPKTNFRCGSYTGGEYLADVETNCQVFHVCFGGRQASFVCPVGTAFSQQLLVCDWWHKVKCGGEFTRPQRSVKHSDHPWHILNALAGVDPMAVVEAVTTDTEDTQPQPPTESPTESSTQAKNDTLTHLEARDVGSRANFSSTTTERVYLDVSMKNGTIGNTTKTASLVITDESPLDAESDV